MSKWYGYVQEYVQGGMGNSEGVWISSWSMSKGLWVCPWEYVQGSMYKTMGIPSEYVHGVWVCPMEYAQGCIGMSKIVCPRGYVYVKGGMGMSKRVWISPWSMSKGVWVCPREYVQGSMSKGYGYSK